MAYKINFKINTLLLSIVSMTLLTSCATYKKIDSDKKVTIEQTGSIMARITSADLYKSENNEVKLRGELKRTTFLKAPIPGHLDIELVDLNGKIIKETQLNYIRKHSKSRFSRFSITLPVEPDLLSIIRIKHHNASSHRSNSKSSPWQDVEANK